MDLKRIFAERISFVYGPSGSGKTVLVSEIVRQFADEGRRVVWISFNESRDVLVNMPLPRGGVLSISPRWRTRGICSKPQPLAA